MHWLQMNKRAPFVFYLLLFFIHAIGQTKKIENIVFEGAGIRGIGYAGAVAALQEQQLLAGIQRVGGTSAGAITALMLSIGYTSDEIATIISKTDFKNFNDGRYFFIGGIHRLRRYFGWYQSAAFERWLDKIIKAKTGNASITFAELKQRGFKDLYVTGTNLTEQKLMLFSHEHSPQMKVKDAVRISMSIPLYFEAVFLDSVGNVVHRPKNKRGLNALVDGGFLANFPIAIFDSTKYTDAALPNRYAVNQNTIGFRIDSDAQIKYDSLQKGLTPLSTGRLSEYITAFYTLVIENLNRQALTPQDWARTVSISDGAIGPRIKKLSRKQLGVLITNGENATLKYLQQ